MAHVSSQLSHAHELFTGAMLDFELEPVVAVNVVATDSDPISPMSSTVGSYHAIKGIVMMLSARSGGSVCEAD